jgi:NADPH-dependent curcumin reductase
LTGSRLPADFVVIHEVDEERANANPSERGIAMNQTNRQILLASRPEGAMSPENFKLVVTPLAPLGEGQFRVRNRYLSIDPYMRGRMNDTKSYAPAQPLGEVMIGETAGEVIESKHPDFAVGEKVTTMSGWQEFGTSDGTGVRKVDDTKIPLSAYLGAVGMPGVTAWYGLNKIVAPRAAETIVVSAASGAVGSIVGQLAKLAGARAVGIAGGPEKCRYVVDTLGFDACVDYRAGNLEEDLKAATPNGVDGCFENVGGALLDATLIRMNPFARIAVCGMIAGYDGQPAPLTKPAIILTMRLTVQGFIVTEHRDVWPKALGELASLVAENKLHYRESIVEGLERAPEALMDVLKGRNFGKQIVRLS